MNEIFADTFYWIALLNPDDNHHAEASRLAITARLVTSWVVIVEVMDALCERSMRPLARRFWEEVWREADVVIVPLDEPLMEEAAELFAAREDKDWSMTDCVSFTIMDQRDITQALTGDHLFRQAGFETVFA